METRRLAPWDWQEKLGYSQGWRVDGAETLVFLAGQGPSSDEGELVGEGDFEAQVRQTFTNIRTLLEDAGASMERIVKLTVYLTDIGRLSRSTLSPSCSGHRRRAARRGIRVGAAGRPQACRRPASALSAS